MKYYDPCSGSRAVKGRWWIAMWLNRIPRTCWPSIVSWALGSRRIFDRDSDGIRRTSMCFSPGQSTCYCGKFANPLQLDASESGDGAGDETGVAA